MRMRLLQDNWNRLGQEDPLWAVASDPACKGGGWDEDAFFATGRAIVAHVLDHATAEGLDVARGSAFDFGCGVGRLSQALAEVFETVAGADIAPAMLDHARRYNRHGDRVTYFLNERPDLSQWQTSSFDLVLSEITLQHMEPRYFSSYIAEFLRIARPGGLVVFQLPNRRRRQAIREKIPAPMWHAVQAVRTHRAPRMEMYGMDPPVLRDFLAAHGGRVVSEEDLGLEDTHEINRRYYVRPPA
jgi:SAM-dependent methyltransferase